MKLWLLDGHEASGPLMKSRLGLLSFFVSLLKSPLLKEERGRKNNNKKNHYMQYEF
jgi:hypothetical protein